MEKSSSCGENKSVMVYLQTGGESWAPLRKMNVWMFVNHPSAFHCPLSKWLWRTGSETFLASPGRKRQLQTDLFSQVLTHGALQSPGHPRMCHPTVLQQDLLNYPACPWTGWSLERGQPPAESSPCQVCQANWFSSKTFGPLWAKRNHISSPFCSKGSKQKSPIWTRGCKVPLQSPTEVLDVAQDSNAVPVAADEGSAVTGLTPLV